MIGAINNVVNVDLGKLYSPGDDWRYIYVIVDGASSGVRILPHLLLGLLRLSLYVLVLLGGSPSVIGASPVGLLPFCRRKREPLYASRIVDYLAGYEFHVRNYYN